MALPPIRMVEGAEEWCDAIPVLGPAAAMVGAGVAVAAVAGFADAVPRFTGCIVAILVVLTFGSKGGRSIKLPSVGCTRFTI